MAIISRFIGADKYLDATIRDLPGAKRDASALWALFADTFPRANNLLVEGSNATADRIKKALWNTLEAASEEDSVIFYFAGHGTPDHRLVAYDSSFENWGTTTIPIEELSSLFKQSKAKALLCILDCCFSGGVTGRVFDEAPIPRNTDDSLNKIAGEGQVFMAASDFNQYSYEIPTTGHGLFTKALLNVFTTIDEPTDIQVISSQVMELVRAEAAKLGLQQTPVCFGQIKGGLQFPKLVKGLNFKALFPETSDRIISKNIKDLSEFKINGDILNAWSARFTKGLNELQLDAVNKHRILDGASLMVVAPTSSGKTFIGEIAAAKAISDEKKVIFLLPYRALVNEKFDYLNDLYGNTLGMRVIRCTGDYSDQASYFVKGKYDIALLTYEMFLGISVNIPHVLNSIGLVILDEAQFITDPNRGITVELLLTNLITAKEKGILPQLITLSATVGDINFFNEWLDINVLKTDRRPVPLTEGVLDRTGILQYQNPQGKILTKQLLPIGTIFVRKQKAGSQDIIVPLVKQLIRSSDKEKIIIFRNKRGSASGCAKYLAAELGLPPAQATIARLPTLDLTNSSNDLRNCLTGGTAFHSTDLNKEERILVEQSFRERTKDVRVLVSTTTVAAGINTPASTVILVENAFQGATLQPYTVAEYKNMAGRAGRVGYQEEGLSIMLADTQREREYLFHKYVLGSPEPIVSSFKEEELSTWLLRLLAQAGSIPQTEVIRILINTFGGYLKNRQNPGWKNTVAIKLESLLQTLISHELVEEENGFVRLSILGIACGQSTLSFDSIIRLIDLIKQHGNKIDNINSLMVLTQALPELDSRYIPLAKNEIFNLPSTTNIATTYLLRRFTQDALTFSKRQKRVSLLLAWLGGMSIDQICTTHSKNIFSAVRPGDVTGLADITRYSLRSVHQIAAILLQTNCPDDTELEKFMRRLEFGIPEDAIELLELPIALERGEYLALREKGIKTKEEYWKQNKKIRKSILGSKSDKMDSLKKRAKELV